MHILKKIESVIVKITCLQFLFLILAQLLLRNKEIAPYLSKTVFSEGVFFESVLRVMETLDHFG
ncbi:hypothetical protein BKP35_02460 [Anaerobacillus arseniciselenatis]|uniref:Uncharacterized protein n=1 Tax=Anaerobacillus arseniciselenatis TaxID=85682 RepID=A0A1S2LVU5_9BACI|nr:DUF5359 family protein [Anaerobacillus arseniciselenatis]OIJ16293.1 hypothetical protein BKP35_02460 [Anaerobacillus arseniciselenatis]